MTFAVVTLTGADPLQLNLDADSFYGCNGGTFIFLLVELGDGKSSLVLSSARGSRSDSRQTTRPEEEQPHHVHPSTGDLVLSPL